jgi:hypothetical protein
VGSSWAAQSARVWSEAPALSVFLCSHGVAACATCAPRTQRKRHHGPDAMCPRVQTQAHNNVPAICPDDNLALLGHSCGRCSRLSTSDRSRGGVTHFCVFLSDPNDVSLSHTTTTPPPHTQHTQTHTGTRLYLTFTLAIHPQEGLATVLALATPTALNTSVVKPTVNFFEMSILIMSNWQKGGIHCNITGFH